MTVSLAARSGDARRRCSSGNAPAPGRRRRRRRARHAQAAEAARWRRRAGGQAEAVVQVAVHPVARAHRAAASPEEAARASSSGRGSPVRTPRLPTASGALGHALQRPLVRNKSNATEALCQERLPALLWSRVALVFRKLSAASCATLPVAMALAGSGRVRQRILHTMLRVGDLARSVDFYTKVMGMRVLRSTDRTEQQYSLTFVGFEDESEGPCLELTYNYGVDKYELGSAYGHIAIAVENAAEACARVTAAGGNVTRPAGPVKGGRTVIAFITDPDGYKSVSPPVDFVARRRSRSQLPAHGRRLTTNAPFPPPTQNRAHRGRQRALRPRPCGGGGRCDGVSELRCTLSKAATRPRHKPRPCARRTAARLPRRSRPCLRRRRAARRQARQHPRRIAQRAQRRRRPRRRASPARPAPQDELRARASCARWPRGRAPRACRPGPPSSRTASRTAAWAAGDGGGRCSAEGAR